jgi:hypothetical protein
VPRLKSIGAEINTTMLDPEVAKWLIDGYGLSGSVADNSMVSRTQKHALTIRTCKCGKKIAGNVYFKHNNQCRAVPRDIESDAV